MPDPRAPIDEMLDATIDLLDEPCARASLHARLLGEQDSRTAAGEAAPPTVARRQLLRRPLVRAFIAATATTAAVLVAVALAPSGGPDGPSKSVPRLTPDASAAETLRWAGAAIVADGAGDVGSGPTWHSVQVTHTGDDVERVEERWLDVRSGNSEERSASRSSGRDYRRGVDVSWTSAHVSTTLDGAVSSRSYRRTDGEDWVADQLGQADFPDGVRDFAPMIGGPPPKIISRLVDGRQVPVKDPAPDPAAITPLFIGATVSRDEATSRWIIAAERAHGPSDLERATAIFLRTTRGYFVDTGADANPRARRRTTVEQLLHLLQNARSTPEATRFLYERFADAADLRRLQDTEVAGRTLLRIQYDFGDISGAPEERAAGGQLHTNLVLATEETVLLIDADDGSLFGTSTIDGATWTEHRPASRVERAGGSPIICHDVFPEVPCDMLDGEGSVAELANDFARSEQSRQMVEQLGGDGLDHRPAYASVIGELGDMRLDKDGIPHVPLDRPIGLARSQWGQRVPVYPLQELPED